MNLVSACCNCVVHVFAAPQVDFTKPLQDVEVREKESAKFECEVSRESAKVRISFKTRWFPDGGRSVKG